MLAAPSDETTDGDAVSSRSIAATEKLFGLGIRGRLMFFLVGVLLCALLSRYKPGADADRDASAAVKSLVSKFRTKSLRLWRISSSRVLVASFKLMRSVALSLLRLLRAAISRCKFVAMLVRLRIWDEMASNVYGARPRVADELVMFESGASESARVRIDCRASIVPEGGVFSPCVGLFSSVGVALPPGVGVSDPDLLGLFSADRGSYSDILGARRPLSGERRSSESLSPRTLPFWTDWMRRWCGLIRLFSGDPLDITLVE